ncbi:putative Puff-specific protein Bx42 [Blattamonas nauphoetae]|uniref:Puff-specific protein Bx42 n=1 Tax=Blattamonas nauphoetae TaxID=2049346 RepID=A0ABQ9Y3Y0_9EUKA|nr:putative Puff-specific protein Bx42 [Blattamonas nauphoetae]
MEVKYVDPDFPFPSHEETATVIQATSVLLQNLVHVAMGGQSDAAKQAAETRFIQYTPSEQSKTFTETPKQRVIKMSAWQVDPLEPPKFKPKNTVRDPHLDSAPVMHSPTRRLTAEEQQQWTIPPAVSNWKNPHGYVIPLDKREAADGRNLQETVVNDNFAQLSSTLYATERLLREEFEQRKAVEEQAAKVKQAEKERRLREIANEARMERGGIRREERDSLRNDYDEKGHYEEKAVKQEERDSHFSRSRSSRTEEDNEREIRRIDDRTRREREYRKQRGRGDDDRLVLDPKGGGRTETLYDERLFNRTGGLDSGFGNEDDYNVFDQPLFKNNGSAIDRLYHAGNGKRMGEDLDEDFEQASKVSKS